MSPTRTVPIDRAAINRANSQHSTGPRTAAGKQRSSQNALRHGLTARTPVLTSEDQTAYENHHRQFENEHKPANVTESQLVKELADTSWRLNRIPLLEADILNRVQSQPPAPSPLPSILSTPTAANSKKRSSSSATSSMSAKCANGTNSKTPPPSWNSINMKDFPRNPPTMASFVQKTKSSASPNA